MKWLKIIGLAGVMWGVSLVWLELGQILASPLVIGVAIGLILGIPAYILGHYFGRTSSHTAWRKSYTYPNITSPLLARYPMPTRPIRSVHTGSAHSQPTQPMSLVSR